jgi:pilus assembly protein CpaF
VADVLAGVRGVGPLAALLAEPGVSDVLVNGPRDVWVDRGRGLEPVDVDVGDVRALAVRLAAVGGARLDDAAPVADARLPGGVRLHAVLPPLAADGPVVSLRVLRRRAFDLAELVAAGSLHPAVAEILRALVARRANLLVSGGTGSGKTTLLATLLSLVPPDERIVCIEEAVELAPAHPHVVHLQARRANVEGAGEVTLAELVRHALRMRPDRVVLGECRGAEVREVLTALNTGHDGGCATVHANAPEDVPARLAALGALAGMAPEAVALQAISALDAVVHVRRGPDGRRRVAQVAAVADGGPAAADGAPGAAGPGPGRAAWAGWRVVPVLSVDEAGRAVAAPGWPAFAARWGLATAPAGRAPAGAPA